MWVGVGVEVKVLVLEVVAGDKGLREECEVGVMEGLQAWAKISVV